MTYLEERADRQNHDNKLKELEQQSDKAEDVKTIQERYNKQKEINKELVEENESLKAQIEKMKIRDKSILEMVGGEKYINPHYSIKVENQAGVITGSN